MILQVTKFFEEIRYFTCIWTDEQFSSDTKEKDIKKIKLHFSWLATLENQILSDDDGYRTNSISIHMFPMKQFILKGK